MKKFNTLGYVILAIACLANITAFGMKGSAAGPSSDSAAVESATSSLALLHISRAEVPTGTVKITTSDGKEFEIPASIAYESQTLKAVFLDNPLANERTKQAAPLRIIDSTMLQQIIDILTKFKKIKPYFAKAFYAEKKVKPFVTAKQVQPVANAIFAKLTPKEIGTIAQAENFLDIPALRNALASYIADVFNKHKPEQINISKNNLADIVQVIFGFKPSERGISLDIYKHLLWRKDGVTQERCIADRIHEKNHPLIMHDLLIRPPLLELDLKNQELTSLEGLQLIKSIHTAQILSFEDNYIQTVPANIFNGLTNALIIRLSHNKIHTLQSGAFNGLDNLDRLILEYNKIQILPANIFKGLANLKMLRLNENWLYTLPLGIFNGLVNLVVLDLSQNQLQRLQANIFNGLGKLQILDLRVNHLSPRSHDLILQAIHSAQHSDAN